MTRNLRSLLPPALLLVALAVFLTLNHSAAAQSAPPPAETPNAGNGLAIYSQRCANCHGPTGMGDGELADRSPMPPTQIGTDAYRRTAVPTEMFNVITNGRMANGMPLFGPESSNPLSEQERWNTIAGVFALGTDEAALANGETLYAENCLACHGPDGAELPDSDLTNVEYWWTRSNQMVFDALPEIPEHEEYELGEDDLWDLIDFSRTFAYVNEAVEAAPAAQTLPEVVVRGQVVNGTTGDTAPAGTRAIVRVFDQMTIAEEITTTVNASGVYSVTIANASPEWVYIAGVAYEDVQFASDIGRLAGQEPVVELPVIVYDQTTSPDAVTIETLSVVVDFVSGGVEIAELYSFSNNSLAVFVGESGNPALGTVQIALPAQVENVRFERPLGTQQVFPAEEVIPTETGYADTLVLRPGTRTLNLLVRYQLPYDDQLTVAHPLNYRVNRAAITLPDVGVALDEEGGWQTAGPQQMGNETVVNYIREQIPAGEPLNFSLEGEPERVSAAAPGGGNSAVIRNEERELMVGAVALGIGLAAAFFVLQRTRAAPARANLSPAEEREELLLDIADLDDEYADGDISAGEYQRERQRLKARLLDIWNEE